MVNHPDEFEHLSAPQAEEGPDPYAQQLLQDIQETSNDIHNVAGDAMEGSESLTSAQTDVMGALPVPERQPKLPDELTQPQANLSAPSTDLAVNTLAAIGAGDVIGRVANDAMHIDNDTYKAAIVGNVAPIAAMGTVGVGASLAGGGIAALAGESALGAVVAGVGSTVSAGAALAAAAPLAIGAGVGAMVDRNRPARGAMLGAVSGSVASTLALGGGVAGAAATGGTAVLLGGAGVLAHRLGQFSENRLGAPKGGVLKNTLVRGFGAPLYIPYRLGVNAMKNVFGARR